MSLKAWSTCRCSQCTIFTASQSQYRAGKWRCDKDALTIPQAQEKKRRADEV